MKKGLLLVVALLALSGLMAAMAYSTATVTNASMLVIKNSSESLLALIPSESGEGAAKNAVNKDATAYIRDDGRFVLDFGRGLDGNFGLQRDSVYEWAELFKIKNNTSQRLQVNVQLNEYYPTYIKFEASWDGKTWVDLNERKVGDKPALKAEVQDFFAGDERNVSIRISVVGDNESYDLPSMGNSLIVKAFTTGRK